MSGWRDIASAPKDGTVVLGYIPDSATLLDELLMRWDEEDLGWRQIDSASTYIVDVDPTHWMPLPPAPSAVVEG